MTMVRRLMVAAGVCAAVGEALAAAPVASVFAVTPSAGGGAIIATQAEAAALHNAHVGPPVDTVLPGWRGHRTGRSLGALVEVYARPLEPPAARSPSG